MKSKGDLSTEIILMIDKQDFGSPWSKSVPLKKTRKSPLASDQRISELSLQIQELKNSTRFTKMVELENEVAVYYKQVSRLQGSFKESFDLTSIQDSLMEYKIGLESLKSRVKDLSLKNKDLKSSLSITKQENSHLKNKIKELKAKEVQYKSDLVSYKNETIKKLEKKTRENELEKSRLGAEYGRVIKELTDKINALNQQVQSKIKTENIFSRPASFMLQD